jgi:nucleotide-binding universal stress UspA family protein
MYKTILVTLDGTPTDRAIIEHIKALAGFMKSRVVLLHVVASASAKYHGPNAADLEAGESQAYLDGVQTEFTVAGITGIRPRKSSNGSARRAATWWR